MFRSSLEIIILTICHGAGIWTIRLRASNIPKRDEKKFLSSEHRLIEKNQIMIFLKKKKPVCTNAEQWLKLRIMKFQKTFHGYRSLGWWKESFLKLPSGNPLLYAISEPHTFPVCCSCFHSPPALTFVVLTSLDHHWLLMAVTSKVTCMLENCHANSTENFPSRNYKESEATAGRSLGLFISNSGYSIISDSWGEVVVF